MIQRIQSVYLLLASLACLACLCLPVGSLTNVDGSTMKMFNLMVLEADGARNFIVAPLFVILVLAIAICIYTIFIYNNRKTQARFCTFAQLMLAGWCVLYPVLMKTIPSTDFDIELTAFLPLVALILCKMAQRGINHDERLVRAADRIR